MSPLIFIVNHIFLTIKNASAKYQHFFQPFVQTISWFFCVIPFLVIFPMLYLIINSDSSSDFINLIRVVITMGLFEIITGVTLTAIFIAIILNKEENEKKFKFVYTQMSLTFFKNGIHPESFLGNIIYSRFMKFRRNRREIAKVHDQYVEGLILNVIKP